MKTLHLTGIKRVLNEAAQKRLDEYHDKNDYSEPKDENGMTLEKYYDLGLSPPKDLVDKSEDYLEFDLDSDYDAFEVPILINMRDFTMCIEDEEEGSIVYLKNKNNIYVLEDTDEIYSQIWWNDRTWWEKAKQKYNEIKNKFKTKK